MNHNRKSPDDIRKQLAEAIESTTAARELFLKPRVVLYNTLRYLQSLEENDSRILGIKATLESCRVTLNILIPQAEKKASALKEAASLARQEFRGRSDRAVENDWATARLILSATGKEINDLRSLLKQLHGLGTKQALDELFAENRFDSDGLNGDWTGLALVHADMQYIRLDLDQELPDGYKNIVPWSEELFNESEALNNRFKEAIYGMAKYKGQLNSPNQLRERMCRLNKLRCEVEGLDAKVAVTQSSLYALAQDLVNPARLSGLTESCFERIYPLLRINSLALVGRILLLEGFRESLRSELAGNSVYEDVRQVVHMEFDSTNDASTAA